MPLKVVFEPAAHAFCVQFPQTQVVCRHCRLTHGPVAASPFACPPLPVVVMMMPPAWPPAGPGPVPVLVPGPAVELAPPAADPVVAPDSSPVKVDLAAGLEQLGAAMAVIPADNDKAT